MACYGHLWPIYTSNIFKWNFVGNIGISSHNIIASYHIPFRMIRHPSPKVTEKLRQPPLKTKNLFSPTITNVASIFNFWGKTCVRSAAVCCTFCGSRIGPSIKAPWLRGRCGSGVLCWHKARVPATIGYLNTVRVPTEQIQTVVVSLSLQF